MKYEKIFINKIKKENNFNDQISLCYSDDYLCKIYNNSFLKKELLSINHKFFFHIFIEKCDINILYKALIKNVKIIHIFINIYKYKKKDILKLSKYNKNIFREYKKIEKLTKYDKIECKLYYSNPLFIKNKNDFIDLYIKYK